MKFAKGDLQVAAGSRSEPSNPPGVKTGKPRLPGFDSRPMMARNASRHYA